MAKKQFKKEIELSDEELFEDTESVLEKEQILLSIKSKKEQIFTEPKHDSLKEKFDNHRDYLVCKHKLDKNKSIAVSTKTLKVLNIDYCNIINNRIETIPNYLEKIFSDDYQNILHYDAVMLSTNEILKNYLLKL